MGVWTEMCLWMLEKILKWFMKKLLSHERKEKEFD
jgi:hypothetical protein